jgi:hypothetical protein
MVEVLIEVHEGAAHFSVSVRAESIQRAVDIVGGRYPGRDVRVKFPIDPVGFFAKNPATRSGIVEIQRPRNEVAA